MRVTEIETESPLPFSNWIEREEYLFFFSRCPRCVTPFAFPFLSELWFWRKGGKRKKKKPFWGGFTMEKRWDGIRKVGGLEVGSWRFQVHEEINTQEIKRNTVLMDEGPDRSWLTIPCSSFFFLLLFFFWLIYLDLDLVTPTLLLGPIHTLPPPFIPSSLDSTLQHCIRRSRPLSLNWLAGAPLLSTANGLVLDVKTTCKTTTQL